MVTLGRAGYQQTSNTAEYYGKSTDEKPTEDVQNGSTFYEIDTQKVFMFDEETATWIEQ